MENLELNINDLLELEGFTQYFGLLPHRRIHGLLIGQHSSELRGRGLDFSEVRKYVAGDDIRNIDWNVTARMQETYTKVFTEEKERPQLIILDQSKRMVFGSDVQLKINNYKQIKKNIALITTVIFFVGFLSCNNLTAQNTKSNKVQTNSNPIVVTEANFTVAEVNKYMSEHAAKHPVNIYNHVRIMSDKDNQFIVRENQDVMYSHAVVDVSEGAIFTNPEWDIYATIQIFDENQYTLAVVYPGEKTTITKDMLALGNHVYASMRTGVRTLDKKGYDEAHKHQNSCKIIAKSSKPYILKNFDEPSLDSTKAKLKARVRELTKPQYYFGNKSEIDSVQFLLASASGTFGLPIKHATYLPLFSQGDAKLGKCSSITINVPPLNFDKGGFFSITTYNSEGWIATDNFALNNVQAKANKDGTYTFHFNCPDKINNIDVVKDWNLLIRLYVPNSTKQILEYIKTINENVILK